MKMKKSRMILLNWRGLMNCEEDQNDLWYYSSKDSTSVTLATKNISRITFAGYYAIANLLSLNYEVTENNNKKNVDLIA